MKSFVVLDQQGKTNLHVFWYADADDEEVIDLIGDFSDCLGHQIHFIPILTN